MVTHRFRSFSSWHSPVAAAAALAALLFGASPAGLAGTLTGSFASIAAGANVDLTATGKLDWVQWGLYTATSLNRKASVSPQISNFTLVGTAGNSQTAYQYANNANGYTWYDGWPVAGVTNTTTGVWAYQYGTYSGYSDPVGSGFRITVPAGPTNEILLVYVGAYAAEGQLTASLSDGGSFTSTQAQTVNNLGSGPGGVFTLNFKANSPGQTLTVTWKLATAYDTSGGNVTLQAAALTATNADNPPYVTLTNPPPFSEFPESNSITLQAAAQDFDSSVTNVSFYAGTNVVGQSAISPYGVIWTNPVPGHYFLTAKATDNLGAVGVAPPVEVFVYGAGGTQTNSVASPPPATVDLTGEGTADWIHWGASGAADVDRKSYAAPQISDFTELGTNTVMQYSNNYTSFSWSDGTPTAADGGTPTGIFVYGETNGFTLTVPAGPHARQLRLYVGGYGVQGELEAWLSDFSAAPFIDVSSVSNVYGSSYAAFTINYTAATTNQQLTVVWRSLQLFDQVYGNVTLQSATLQSDATPQAEIVGPAMVGNNLAFSFLAHSNYTYSVQAAAALPAGSWLTLTNFPGNGTIVTVTNPSLPGATGFYRVLTQ